MNIKYIELVSVAKDFLHTNYNLELKIPIEFNTRVKKAFGRFLFKENKRTNEKTPLKIEMSVDFMMSHPKDHIIDVFKHELVHYALCALGKPFADNHPIFESELKRLNVTRTHTYQYAGDLHKYSCEICGNEFKRKRRLNQFARCGCSVHSKLIYMGIINVEAKAANNRS